MLRRNIRLALAAFLLVAFSPTWLRGAELESAALLQNLQNQGVLPQAVLGTDVHGVPIACGTGLSNPLVSQKSKDGPPVSTRGVIPVGLRSWECVPGVIRDNGADTFRLEVDVNGPVQVVILTSDTNYEAVLVAGPYIQALRDDGQQGDREAGDYVFTSSLMRYNTNFTMISTYLGDWDSPSGITFAQFGIVDIVETNGQVRNFLILPTVGVLRRDIPAVETVALSSNVQISPHLINLRTTGRQIQRALRKTVTMDGLSTQLYSALPDAFDFMVFFSMDHVEFSNYLATVNFNAGTHTSVRINHTGTGQANYDLTWAYGSDGRLLGISLLDTCGRGVYSYNATHELMHQWASFLSSSLGLGTGDGHYIYRCSAASAVGGDYWMQNFNGSHTHTCRSYAGTRAPLLDRYLMGLIPGADVPPLMVAGTYPFCGEVISNITRTVTISGIQAVHGVRTPTPTNSQKDFSIAFVAESYGRFLTPTEMTFYEILADHYTKPIPAWHGDPDVGGNWVSIRRYFGEDTTWTSDVLFLIRPSITFLEQMTNGGTRISATGYPGRDYRLLKTTNFVNWIAVTNKTAEANGTFALVDGSTATHPTSFYRIATP